MTQWNIIRKIDQQIVAIVQADALIESIRDGETRQIFIADYTEVLQVVLNEAEYEVQAAKQ